jgi:DNA repair protein RadA/Sms
MSEEVAVAEAPRKVSLMGFQNRNSSRTSAKLTPTGLSGRAAPPARITTGHKELDRVLGGGLVEGSAILIGGAPGMGKSTLLLQVSANLSETKKVVYISGEESLDQIQLRARRLEVEGSDVDLISSNDCLAIADHIETLPPGSVVIVDSVQTLYSGGDSTPGSVSQVKSAAAHLIPAAKNRNISLLLVSHLTKDGAMAGPNVLMHAVDTVLYLDTDTSSGLYRVVRSEKNRFGAVDEVGIFEMTERGMSDVHNPSEIFIAQRDETAFGTVIFPSLEGTRPLLVEVQALVAPTTFGTGRRSTTGWDSSRLNMLLATLSARLGLSLADRDVYVNVAGGLRVSDPAMDLAVATAVLSAKAQVALPAGLAVFGEVGLAGEVRNSSRAEARIKEASRLGLSNILCPTMQDKSYLPGNIQTSEIRRIAELIASIPDLQILYQD